MLKRPIGCESARPLLYLAIAIIAIALRIMLVIALPISRHDDSLAYLAATGHLGKYKEVREFSRAPIGLWTDVEQWKRFVKADGKFHFSEIMYDLSQYDVHPPLYFWLLHTALILFDTTPWFGPALNILFELGTAFILVKFVSRYLGNTEALVITAIWIFHPYTVQASTWTRQYSLLTLCGVIFTVVTVELFTSKTVKTHIVAFLILITIVGLLTHYHFALFALLCAILAVSFYAHARNYILRILLSILPFLILVILLTSFIPILHTSAIHLLNYWLSNSNGIALPLRVEKLWLGSLLLFCPLFMLAAIIVFYRIVEWRLDTVEQLRGQIASPPPPSSSFLSWMTTMGIGLWLMVALLYISGISPVHAFGAKYTSFITPYVAFASLNVSFLTKRDYRKLFLPLIFAMVGINSLIAIYGFKDLKANSAFLNTLQNESMLVLDTVEPGEWPSVILHLQDGTKMLAADQQYLQEHSNLTLYQICRGEAAYLSYITVDNAEGNPNEFLDLLRRHCPVYLSSKLVWNWGNQELHIYKSHHDPAIQKGND